MWKQTLMVLLACLVVAVGTGFCLTGAEVVALREAGISDATIQVIVREKIVETRAFTVQEIIGMKQSGIGDETLQVLLEESSFLKQEKNVVYGDKTRPLKLTTVEDLKALKAAGMSDDILKALIIYSSRDSSDLERERSQAILQEMGVVVIP
jgi:hypothetical protein